MELLTMVHLKDGADISNNKTAFCAGLRECRPLIINEKKEFWKA